MTSQLNPCIGFNGNAREAMEFYQEVLGGQLETITYGDLSPAEAPSGDADKIMHSTLNTSDGYTVMAWDVPKRVPFSPGNNVALFLGGAGAHLREYFEKLSSGGAVTLPLEKQAWGNEAGSLVDKFGISWMVNISQQQS